MNDGRLQVALREMRAHIGRRTVLTALIAVGIVLGLAGPFGTLHLMGLGGRVAYWLFVTMMSYGVGATLSILIEHEARARKLSPFLAVPLSAFAISVPVAAVLFALNFLVFAYIPDGPGEMLGLLANILAVSFAVTIVLHIAEDSPHPEEATRQPALLERLAPSRRGELISLSVSDHYVEVVTERGREMILMRLSDAIREAGDGVQIHRSHWVAKDAIADVRRMGDGAKVTLADGRELPASRSRLDDLRRLGWLGGPR